MLERILYSKDRTTRPNTSEEHNGTHTQRATQQLYSLVRFWRRRRRRPLEFACRTMHNVIYYTQCTIDATLADWVNN